MLALLLAAALLAQPLDPNRVVLTLDPDAPTRPISRLVYGVNEGTPIDLPFTVFRFGGNSASPYNWETNFDNAGKDWQHSSGYGWSMRNVPESRRNEPAAALHFVLETAQALGAETLLPVNLAGYVAADGDGPVSEAETAPSPRWRPFLFAKNAPFQDPPNANDAAVYLDELVAHLVNRHGPASSPTGVKRYSLDNEPGLWHETHPRIHPEKVRARELVERSIAAAKAIKAVDPTALVHGPNCFGVFEYVHLIEAPDWAEIQAEGGYEWFVDYYLDAFRQASEESGIRLLDVLDLHFYCEGILKDEAGITGIQQGPRSLWDPTHTEGSWLGEVYPQFFPLIPRLRQSVECYYPGTQLCFSEWNAQDPLTLHGAIANADMLGALGREGVEIATWWSLIPGEATPEQVAPARSAMALFLDYDGKGSQFGDRSLPVGNPNLDDVSVYASLGKDGALHLILLGKRRHVPLQIEVPLPNGRYRSVEAYGFGALDGPELKPIDRAQLAPNRLTVELPKYSAAHLVLQP